jgi:YggT family protein
MLAVVIVTFVDLFSVVFTILLFARVLLSWVYPHPGANRFAMSIYELTEPILILVRRLLPTTGMIDLAPLATFFLLQGLVWLAHYLLLKPQ